MSNVTLKIKKHAIGDQQSHKGAGACGFPRWFSCENEEGPEN